MPASGRLCVVVLISGRGSNLGALINARNKAGLAIEIAAVISNCDGAGGLKTAFKNGIDGEIVDHHDFQEREAFDRALLLRIESYKPDLVVLAGFMRILGSAIIEQLKGRTINIHPSLLPAYPGLHTHERALTAGDRQHGASIHFVTGELDGGPVISQVTIETRNDDTADALAARLLPFEHQLMVATVELFSNHSVELRDDCIYVDNERLHAPLAPGDNGRLQLPSGG